MPDSLSPTDGVTLRTRTTCTVEGVDDVWHTDGIRCGDKLEDAIQTVRDDHNETVTIESSPWLLKAHWNDNTESVWVARFAYHGGMEVED